MASPTLPQPPETTLEAFARDVARRRETVGKVEMPRNDGTRRTPSKRALLAAITAAGGKW